MSTIPSNKTKQCRVCGDLALNFNFNVLCCGPCKGFFRRNVLKIEQLKCFNGKNCPIDERNRKQCKLCRIEKCLKVGMRMKIRTEIENHSITHFAYDKTQITQVQSAMSVFADYASSKIVGQVTTVLQAVNLAELFVRSIVQFCHSFAAFTSLKQSDQLILLKSSHSEIATIYVAFLYDTTRDGFPILMDLEEKTSIWIPFDICAQLKNNGFSNIFRNFAHLMHQKMEEDATIRNLIIAQLLFKHHEKVSCPEFIRYNHLFYCHLLRRYFIHKYANSSSKANHRFCSVMSMLDQISLVTEMKQHFYTTEIESHSVAQVIAEIYNLL